MMCVHGQNLEDLAESEIAYQEIVPDCTFRSEMSEVYIFGDCGTSSPINPMLSLSVQFGDAKAPRPLDPFDARVHTSIDVKIVTKNQMRLMGEVNDYFGRFSLEGETGVFLVELGFWGKFPSIHVNDVRITIAQICLKTPDEAVYTCFPTSGPAH